MKHKEVGRRLLLCWAGTLLGGRLRVALPFSLPLPFWTFGVTNPVPLLPTGSALSHALEEVDGCTALVLGSLVEGDVSGSLEGNWARGWWCATPMRLLTKSLLLEALSMLSNGSKGLSDALILQLVQRKLAEHRLHSFIIGVVHIAILIVIVTFIGIVVLRLILEDVVIVNLIGFLVIIRDCSQNLLRSSLSLPWDPWTMLRTSSTSCCSKVVSPHNGPLDEIRELHLQSVGHLLVVVLAVDASKHALLFLWIQAWEDHQQHATEIVAQGSLWGHFLQPFQLSLTTNDVLSHRLRGSSPHIRRVEVGQEELIDPNWRLLGDAGLQGVQEKLHSTRQWVSISILRPQLLLIKASNCFIGWSSKLCSQMKWGRRLKCVLAITAIEQVPASLHILLKVLRITWVLWDPIAICLQLAIGGRKIHRSAGSTNCKVGNHVGSRMDQLQPATTGREALIAKRERRCTQKRSAAETQSSDQAPLTIKKCKAARKWRHFSLRTKGALRGQYVAALETGSYAEKLIPNDHHASEGWDFLTTCWILRTLCMPHVKPAQRASKVSRLLRPTPHGPPLANCRRPLAEDQQLPCKALKLLPTLVQPWEGEMKGNVKHVSFPFKVTCIICIANPGVGLFDADRHAMYLRNYDGWWVNPQPTHLTNLQESRRRHKNRPWISTLETLAQYWNLELGFFSASNISI